MNRYNKMKKVLFLPVFMGILGISCLNNVEDTSGEVQTGVSYINDVQPIFNASCTSCHGISGGVNLNSYQSLIASDGNFYGTNLVVPGDAAASGLVDKIEANPDFGTRMPQGGTLSGNQIETIKAWINEGALNN